jgi:adenylyltransferase/sulfurtransferase
MSLSDQQIERYSRQIVLPEIGARGQEALVGSAAAVIGTGEAARAAASYLAGAGVGRVDLFPGRSESAEAAREIGRQALRLNPEVRVEVQSLPAEPCTDGWTGRYGAVVCASDSATLRAVAAGRRRGTLVAGGPVGSCGWLWIARGQRPGDPCAACAERDALADPSAVGKSALASSVAGVVGSLLSLAALKLLLGIGVEPPGFWLYDGQSESLVLREEARDPCPACRHRGTERP